jgi:hypothetical protein
MAFAKEVHFYDLSHSLAQYSTATKIALLGSMCMDVRGSYLKQAQPVKIKPIR